MTNQDETPAAGRYTANFSVIAIIKSDFRYFYQKIHPPFNANKSSRFVELVMVVDNDVFLQLDSNVTLVHESCHKIATFFNAVINQKYKPHVFLKSASIGY